MTFSLCNILMDPDCLFAFNACPYVFFKQVFNMKPPTNFLNATTEITT